MEVFFLDVAQGTAQVILLGGRRAIVIDCGIPNDLLVVQFLQRMGVDEIECLIISHSHDDHIGGAVTVLSQYSTRIKTICFVQDHEFLASAFWERLKQLLKSGQVTKDQLHRLEATQEPQMVWRDPSRNATLRTFSPSTAENLLAQDAETPNPTSAILFLDVGVGRIIFASDSEVVQWREIHAVHGQFDCDILAVPHHAGKMHSNSSDLKWFLEFGVKAKAAIISVGTSNTHRHPREDVILGLTSRGTKVLCTQITKKCSASLEALRPGVLSPLLHPGKSSPAKDLTSSGNSRNVACAGTVLAQLTGLGFEVARLIEHQNAVNALPKSATCGPLCRR